MLQVYKRMKRMREKYIDTLAKLYEYGTTVYAKKQYTQWYDTKDGGYTYGKFKEKCDSLSKKLTQYGIGAGDKVAIFAQSMPNWSVAFFATVSFGRISIPILPEITGPGMFQSPGGLLLILSVRSHCTQESCLGNPCEIFV